MDGRRPRPRVCPAVLFPDAQWGKHSVFACMFYGFGFSFGCRFGSCFGSCFGFCVVAFLFCGIFDPSRILRVSALRVVAGTLVFRTLVFGTLVRLFC